MDLEDMPVVIGLSRSVLAEVSPGEVPLAAATARAHVRQGSPSRRRRAKGDDLLGFGVGEAVVLLGPSVVQFAAQVWQAVLADAASSTGGSLVDLVRDLRRRFGGGGADEGPPVFTVEQLAYVREVGRRRAAELPLTPEQQVLFVEAMVGGLAAPVAAGGGREDQPRRSERPS